MVRENEILRAGEQLLVSRGYRAMSMDDIADEVGISKATLYQHFASKEDLAAAILIGHLERFVEYLERGPLPDEPPIAYLDRIMRVIVMHRYSSGAPLAGGAGTSDLDIAKRMMAREDFADITGKIFTSIEQVIRQAQQAGQLDPQLTPALAVQMMFGLAQGFDYYELMRAHGLTSADLANQICHTFFAGVAKSAAWQQSLSRAAFDESQDCGNTPHPARGT